MTKLSHPSIAKVFKHFPVWSGTSIIGHCILMEFIEGHNLRHIINRSKEPYGKAIIMLWLIKILDVGLSFFFLSFLILLFNEGSGLHASNENLPQRH